MFSLISLCIDDHSWVGRYLDYWIVTAGAIQGAWALLVGTTECCVSMTVDFSVLTKWLIFDTYRLLPCGIMAPAHEGPPLGTAAPPLEDKLFSASQRYSYFQDKTPPNVDRLQMKRSIHPPARFKNARMTVRLRPRQVLCSKCRGICNENSENVDVSLKKRKNSETETNTASKTASRPERRLRSSGEISPRPVIPENPRAQPKKYGLKVPLAKKKKLCPSPELTLLPSNDNSVIGRLQKIKIVGNYLLKESDGNKEEEKAMAAAVDGDEEDPLSLPVPVPVIDVKCDPLSVEDLVEEQAETDPLDLTAQRVLRKKRSVGSMEDLWDENVLVFKDASKSIEKKAPGNKTKTPVIKISFGSGTGEGTVLKIPAKPQDIPSESESEEKKREKTKRDASAKAAKKALKKAKKEARRKMVEGASPAGSLGGTSPRYPNLSPRYFAACVSPRQTLGNTSPAYEIFHKKHKHKVKHKKKHKDEKKHKDPDDGEGEAEGKEESIRECLKQKLSISLKRLSGHAYTRCTSSSPSASDGSDEASDAVPDFPGNPLMMRISTQTMTSCQTSDGRHMAVGDVVWGKIHGFPWWPGKVSCIFIP